MLVNTAGHANFEIDFDTIFGSGAIQDDQWSPLSSIFDHEGRIYSCFAFGNKVVVYRDAQYHSTITIDSTFTVDDHQNVEAILMNWDANQ